MAHTAVLTTLETARGASPVPTPYTAQHAAPMPIVRKVSGETPVATRLARSACGTVLATASRSRSRPRLSTPAAAEPTIDPAHNPTHADGRRRSRTPATMAIVPHSVAPIPEDHAGSTRPTFAAYNVHPAHDVAAYAEPVTDTPPRSLDRSTPTNCGTTHAVTRVAPSTPSTTTPRSSGSPP